MSISTRTKEAIKIALAMVIPPGSQLVGNSARDVWMRKTYGISLVMD